MTNVVIWEDGNHLDSKRKAKEMKKLYKKIVPLNLRTQIKLIRRKVYGTLFLRGDKVECNVCGQTFSQFLPKGNGIVTRKNALCPNCGSLERTRLLKFYLENQTNFLEPNKHILHFAPEQGIKNLFKKHNQYINGDILPENADEVIDATHIQYPNNTFDGIIFSHILGHIPNQQKALSELKRVLKPTGQIILMTILNQKNGKTIEQPNLSPEQKLRLYGESNLERLHGEEDLEQNLKHAGFNVEIIDYRLSFSNKNQQKYALGNGEREKIFLLTI